MSRKIYDLMLDGQPDGDPASVRNLRTMLHNLKTPLGLVKNLLEFSRREPWFNDLSPGSKLLFLALRRRSDFMLELIGGLSDVSQLEPMGETPKGEC